MDGHGTGPRRSCLRLLLLLGAVALCALVVARLSGRQVDRAPVARAPDRDPGESIASVADDDGAADAPSAQDRYYTACDLTVALVAEFARDPRDDADIAALLGVLRGQSETEILTAAAALLDQGSEAAAATAWRLALDVLTSSGRRVTDDEAYALVGKAAARLLEARASHVAATLAADILARIGTPAAAEILLRLLDRRDPAGGWIGQVTNPASVPVLMQALPTRLGNDAQIIAAALCRSAEGRVELRRLLDPAGGFGAEHADAKFVALRTMATGFREAADLAAIETAIAQRSDLTRIVLDAMRNHGAGSYADPAFPLKSVQTRAIVGFLAGHQGSAMEDALFAMLGKFPETIVDPLLPRLEAARPGARERVEARRKPAGAARAR